MRQAQMKLSRTTIIVLSLLANCLQNLACAEKATHAKSRQPNIIVIMADDIGAEGLACYGSDIYTTPALDRMAAEGILFDNAYATPLCTPTRVMLMCGLYPNRTGFQRLISKDAGVRMPKSLRTFANDFRDAGYSTALAGKWQLGKFDEYPEQPVEHGFDEYCMWTWIYETKKSSRYYGPQIYRNGTITNYDEKDFGPDRYRDFVLDFIDRKKETPFLIYFPMALVHSPFIHPPELTKRAGSRFKQDLDEDTKTFGEMITYMDDSVGRILNKLREHNLEDHTLVIFTGDNGTNKKITSRLQGMTIRGGKGSMTEAGTRVPMIAWWPSRIKPAICREFFSLVDILPTINSIAGIPTQRHVDGMNLSHYLLGGTGENREKICVNFGNGYYVRDHRFRLNHDGKLYDISTESNKTRYSESLVQPSAHLKEREQLQHHLDNFMKLTPLNPATGR